MSGDAGKGAAPVWRPTDMARWLARNAPAIVLFVALLELWDLLGAGDACRGPEVQKRLAVGREVHAVRLAVLVDPLVRRVLSVRFSGGLVQATPRSRRRGCRTGAPAKRLLTVRVELPRSALRSPSPPAT